MMKRLGKPGRFIKYSILIILLCVGSFMGCAHSVKMSEPPQKEERNQWDGVDHFRFVVIGTDQITMS